MLADLGALMARNPDVPCSRCGKFMWSGPGSAEISKRVCRPCRHTPEHVAIIESRKVARGRVKNYQPPAPCAQCSTVFTPSQKSVRTCSLTCGQKLRWAEGRQPPGQIKYHTPEQAKAGTLDRWQRKNRRRRAQKRGAASERYTLAEIAARDYGKCGLCGKRVPMDHKHPDPLSATIDHVIPISLGGDDTRANVQLAHFRCNNAKGARRAGEQLALIG